MNLDDKNFFGHYTNLSAPVPLLDAINWVFHNDRVKEIS